MPVVDMLAVTVMTGALERHASVAPIQDVYVGSFVSVSPIQAGV
jgi:hypothetical protein